MTSPPRTLLVCSCEDTVKLDIAAIGRGCRGARIEAGRQLCRSELERFRKLAASGVPMTVGCTQEAPLFAEVAAETAGAGEISFANIREFAGWSEEAAAAGPKMAALLAAAAEPIPAAPLVSMESGGVALVYGRDNQAIEAGRLLKNKLDVTVMLTRPQDVIPPRATSAPLNSSSTIMRSPRPPHAARCGSARRATARSRIATSSSIFPAARRCSRRRICATAMCA